MDTAGRIETEPRSKLSRAPARAVLRVEDYQRAKAFYSETLGLPVDDIPGVPGNGIAMAGDGTQVELHERPGTPPPRHTVLGFHAVDFDTTFEDLRSRGVRFEDHDIPELGVKTENGVAEIGGAKMAWFKDTEGNILSVGTM